MTASRRAVGSFVIQAGLMGAPVQAFTSIGENESKTKRRELHTVCKGTLGRKQWCGHCNKEVPKDEVAKGYEYEKDHFVMLSDEECKALHVTSKSVFTVESFVDPINPVFYDKAYDLGPGKGGEGFFNLLINGLATANKIAVGKITMRDREQLAALHVEDGVLFMHTLFYGEEVRPELGQSLPSVDSKILQQMLQYIGILAGEFKPTQTTDAYTEAFLKAVDLKRKDPNALVATPAAAAPVAAVDLADALRQMLAQATPVKVKKGRKTA